MNSKAAFALFAFLSVAGLFWVGLRGPACTGGEGEVCLTQEQIDSLFSCTCYPGQVPSDGTVRLMKKHAEVVVLARIEGFELNESGFGWTVFLRTAEVLKGAGKAVYELPISSPERNFGSKPEGRLFFLFLRGEGGRMRWALEPWLPEIGNILEGN